MKLSAGILLYKTEQDVLKVLLVHPGGPFWQKKDNGAWSIPKGELDEGENALLAAKREFYEETGSKISGKCIAITPVRQAGGKVVYPWACRGELDTSAIKSNLFEMEWPPKSGKKKQFPEIDKAQWFTIEEAREKIIPAQQQMLNELQELLTKKAV